MDNICVIGLGKMGTALAEAFLRNSLPLTVWNRTPSRSAPLQAQGARVAPTLEAAISASDVIIVSVSNYAAANEFLSTEPAVVALRGKTLIQLTSGTPKEARHTAAWAQEIGAHYLDGAILAYPIHIGTPTARILISGSPDVFHQHQQLLEHLGSPLFVGLSPGAAAALDCAGLVCSTTSMLGLIHGIAVCESENVDTEHLVSMVNAFLPLHADLNRDMAERIRTGNFDNPQAALKTWAAVAHHFVHIAHESNLADDVPACIATLLDRALAAGLGEQEISSVVNVIRPNQTATPNL